MHIHTHAVREHFHDWLVIHSHPVTIEIMTPHVYADQSEYMHHHLERRTYIEMMVLWHSRIAP